MRKKDHVDGACLFSPTRFEPMDKAQRIDFIMKDVKKAFTIPAQFVPVLTNPPR